MHNRAFIWMCVSCQTKSVYLNTERTLHKRFFVSLLKQIIAMEFQYDDQPFPVQIKIHGNQPYLLFCDQPQMHLFDFFEWLMNADYDLPFKYALVDFLGEQMIQIKQDAPEPDGINLMKIGNDAIAIYVKDGIKYYKLNDVARACDLSSISNTTLHRLRDVVADGVKHKLSGMTQPAWFVTRNGLMHLFNKTRTARAHSVLETFFYKANYAIPYHALELYKLFLPQHTGLRKELFTHWKNLLVTI